MAKEKVDLLEIYSPTDPLDRLEYVLQRAKKVISEKTPVVTAHEVRSGPEPTNINEFPSVEIVVRILGIPFEHPLTHKPIIPLTWFKDFFESAAMQKTFIEHLCRHVAERAPDSERLAPIKRKLREVSTGHPSKLPPRLDLLLLHEELIEQIKLAKVWLKQWRANHNSHLANSRAEFLQALSSANFQWLELIKNGQLDIEQIASDPAESTSKSILAERSGASTDAIHSRLFRKK
jgi:hypothetical protein